MLPPFPIHGIKQEKYGLYLRECSNVHGIYTMKFLNYVCVFYMRIETTIQYGHKELKLEQFNKKLKQQFNIWSQGIETIIQ